MNLSSCSYGQCPRRDFALCAFKAVFKDIMHIFYSEVTSRFGSELNLHVPPTFVATLLKSELVELCFIGRSY